MKVRLTYVLQARNHRSHEVSLDVVVPDDDHAAADFALEAFRPSGFNVVWKDWEWVEAEGEVTLEVEETV